MKRLIVNHQNIDALLLTGGGDTLHHDGPITLVGLKNVRIERIVIKATGRHTDQRQLLQDIDCDGMSLGDVLIFGQPDDSSKEAWMATDSNGVRLNSPDVCVDYVYAEGVHVPLRLMGDGTRCKFLDTLNTSGDGFQICGDGARLDGWDINGLLDVYPYEVEHQDVGMIFNHKRETVRDVRVGKGELSKSGHRWEHKSPQGILAPDNVLVNCHVAGARLYGVHPEHGVRFAKAIGCTISNVKSDGALAFGDRKSSAKGKDNDIINCDSPLQIFEDGSQKTEVDEMVLNRKVLFDHLRAVWGKLVQEQVDGIERNLDYWELNHPGSNLAWIAYSLATQWHETARTMSPICEHGGKSYFFKMYDPHGTRPHVAKDLGNTHAGDGAMFCGRGDVMLTGRSNYTRQGKKHGLDLVANPELMLNPDVSIKVLIEGMLDGDFSRVKRGGSWYAASFDAFTADDGTFNAVDARRMINLTDKAHLIAGYHEIFLDGLVKALVDESFEPIPEPVIITERFYPQAEPTEQTEKLKEPMMKNRFETNKRPALQGKKTYLLSILTAGVGVAGLFGVIPGMSMGDSLQLIQTAGLGSTFRSAFSSFTGDK